MDKSAERYYCAVEGTEEVTFGALLRRLRRAAELTQEELAERAGMSVRGIGYLERDTSHAPYQATVLQLAEALQLESGDRAALLAAGRRRLPVTGRLATSVLVAPTPLIGREQEVGEIQTLLTQPGMRLLTILGPGGVGKTRLAMEVAACLQLSFSGGVAIVSLASLNDPQLVLPTIAQVLGLREAPGRLLETEHIEEELRLVSGLIGFWMTHEHWSEAIRWLPLGLARGNGLHPELSGVGAAGSRKHGRGGRAQTL